MNFDSGRIYLDPEPVVAQRAAIEVVMLGHCTGAADLAFLSGNARMCVEMEAQGYAQQLTELRQSSENVDPLYNLPIPITSVAEYARLFPDSEQSTTYASQLAGNRPWLPLCVEDFFRHTGASVQKKLWIINIDQALEQEGFLPDPGDNWLNTQSRSALMRALSILRAGLLLLPDLERLQIPAQLQSVPHLRIANPRPQFLPCGSDQNDGIRERRNAEEMQQQRPPMDFGTLLATLLQAIDRFRPDLHLLFSLPFDAEPKGELPQASRAALADIQSLKNSQLAHSLHRVQLLYPYLRSHRYPLLTAAGLLAGKMAETTATQGAWRSVAGVPLSGGGQPFPSLTARQIARFRDLHGIGIVRSRLNHPELDDERLIGGVFSETAEHARSGEISRFLGWLRRELEALGLNLLFDTDPQDPRPLILLTDFFNRLYQLGALRGKTPEQAFTIRKAARQGSESALIYEIEIAPAFPIDRIRLNLSQERLEVRRG